MTLPAIPVEFIVQLRTHCGMRSYAVHGRPEHKCGICGEDIPPSDEPWELYRPDVTPIRGGVIT